MMGKSEARAELERLRQAMEVVGFFAGAQKNIFKLISAILLLGNITFKVVSPTTGTSSSCYTFSIALRAFDRIAECVLSTCCVCAFSFPSWPHLAWRELTVRRVQSCYATVSSHYGATILVLSIVRRVSWKICPKIICMDRHIIAPKWSCLFRT